MPADLFKVTLFEDSGVVKMNRQLEQVMTRDLKIMNRYKDLSGIDIYFQNKSEAEEYKNYVKEKMASFKRYNRYEFIGAAAQDKFYDIETLNIAEYCREYLLVGDFSDCLDYVLHRTYGCKINDIRKIEDYDSISRSILNFNFKGFDRQATFERLLSASNELNYAFAVISEKANAQEDLSIDDQLSWIIYNFYCNILQVLHKVKYYATMCVCSSSELMSKKGAIRSMSYSSVLASVYNQFNGKVLLTQPGSGFDDYPVVFRTYKPYEYLGEVIRQNEFSWKI